jgi:RNA polymerase sigma factor (TIGR02999 family)
MSEITDLLDRWGRGDAEAFKVLLPRVYEELRHLAARHLRAERQGHTLQPTALVHEAYLRLSGLREMRLHNRAHFYGAAANVMRRVLVDHARRHAAQKRGGAQVALALDDVAAPEVHVDLQLVALDEALAALAEIAPEKARVVELRYFGGLSVEETGEYLGLSAPTVKRYWAFARAWLFSRLASGPLPEAGARR